MGPYMQQVAEQIINGQQPDTRGDMDDRIYPVAAARLGSATASTHATGAALGVELSIDINQPGCAMGAVLHLQPGARH